MPPKGVSAEEKRKRLLKVYHDAKAPFTLKEITKLGPTVGLSEKVVPDVNQQLIDDSLVQTDKIGSSNFYWAFASAQSETAKAAHSDAVAKLDAAKARLAEARGAEARARIGREDNGERAAKLARLDETAAKRKALEDQLERLKENDPEELDRINRTAEAFKGHANRWTENLFSVKSWLIKNKNIASYQVDELFKQCGLPKSMDVID